MTSREEDLREAAEEYAYSPNSPLTGSGIGGMKYVDPEEAFKAGARWSAALQSAPPTLVPPELRIVLQFIRMNVIERLWKALDREGLQSLISEIDTLLQQQPDDGDTEAGAQPSEDVVERLGKPVAWSFELSSKRVRETGEYVDFNPPQLSRSKPCVPEASIRNLTPLYALASIVTPELRKLSENGEWIDLRGVRFVPHETENFWHAPETDERKLLYSVEDGINFGQARVALYVRSIMGNHND